MFGFVCSAAAVLAVTGHDVKTAADWTVFHVDNSFFRVYTEVVIFTLLPFSDASRKAAFLCHLAKDCPRFLPYAPDPFRNSGMGQPVSVGNLALIPSCQKVIEGQGFVRC